ncbi:flagellar biosynthetic protein FlhB [Sulfurihydrogenibium azorense Az-Fu1]|uniref:Flagellar biosynthetic protein FlhB n=1 Tax=Sulfurihydrogenibium azorense (strain DSM 15241 / OCM 825 / Az-Fu1) TaxID=204536 RepID=C1DW37_SULAA|nr:flagellar biosynthesis protein FlhB [Sulfurihydrogenibium azorense]ACN99309.1 flagellar biosynthetic protein FlhB [Sulfurihydrogenibium azorense Az-Fu1]
MAKDPRKTEKATPKRRQKAREEGQVLKSTDVAVALSLFVVFLVMIFYIPFLYKYLLGYFKYTFSNPFYLIPEESGKNFIWFTFKVLAILILPFVSILFIVGIVANVAQFGFLFTLKPLTPKLSKINPISGLQRLFSLSTLFELVKSILKLSLALFVSYFLVSYLLDGFLVYMTANINSQIYILAKTIIILIMAFTFLSIPIAIADFFYRRYEYEENLKMTKDEVKEERKSYEGNPIVKKEIRKRMRQLALKRMIAEVPKADVVITNPDHYAVALKYEKGKMKAPQVIAKGQDLIALKIKEVAKEHNVKIVEDPPLARSLYSSCEVGDYIPEDFYEAVAKILAVIYKQKAKMI